MIGNLSTEIDAKEQYMTAIAPILPDGVRRIKEYIQDMVQIDQRNGEYVPIKLASSSYMYEQIHTHPHLPPPPPQLHKRQVLKMVATSTT